ncbi:hypothetical protein ACE5D9_02585 [Rickettsia sp. 2024-CO-Wats]|uniref:hypothetical protein n=1 Tax=unclassified Rickettsia TaxID=114295 RepID=UPI00370DC968
MAVPSKSLNPTSSRFQPLGSLPQDTPQALYTPLYNENRAQYMTSIINEIRGKGYNVIASVGSSHLVNLEENLENSKKHDIGFHIPRKILQKALNVGNAIPTGMVNIRASTKGNSMVQWKALNDQSKRNISTGR